MDSHILNQIGLGSLDIGYVLICLVLMIIVLLILTIVLLSKFNIMRKKYEQFMHGKDAKSLEEKIVKIIEENVRITELSEDNRKDIRRLGRNQEHCYQKVGINKYDAFREMGGKLSFALALLNKKNNGFIINSVHSTDGCYSYVKEIKDGESELPLGDEEKQALQKAKESKI